MFVAAVFFEARRSYGEELMAALISHAAECRANEPGCERFDVNQDPVDPNSFFVYEVFDSQSAFDAHHELEHYARFASLVEPWVRSKRVLTYTLLDMAGRV